MFKISIYRKWFKSLKESIHLSQEHTALRVNADMLILYWYIGKQLDEKIEKELWGARVVDQLSEDLQNSFPDLKGFSRRNLMYMKQFATLWPDMLIVQQAAAQLRKSAKNAIVQQGAAQIGKITYTVQNPDLIRIPWGHHILLIDKVLSSDELKWYIQNTIENNWSRTALQYQVETDLYTRQQKNKKNSNFHLTLPEKQSVLANQLLKDPYVFGFLQMDEQRNELGMERQLIEHIQEFLIELGAGFAFVGRQVKIKAGRKDYRIDLLFYHIFLRCFIVIDLKAEEFAFEHAGKMNGYLNIINKQFRQQHDNPSIGIILCASKDYIEVDFALTNIHQPIGVSEYKFIKMLPQQLRAKMPTAKQLQTEVQKFLKQQSKRNSSKPNK